MDKTEVKQYTLWITLIGVIGSSAMLTNAIFVNNTNALIASSIGSGMFVLFIALTAELLVVNLKNAIFDQKDHENDSLIAAVVAKSVYTALKEESKKEKI
jgi:hypothetical protein